MTLPTIAPSLTWGKHKQTEETQRIQSPLTGCFSNSQKVQVAMMARTSRKSRKRGSRNLQILQFPKRRALYLLWRLETNKRWLAYFGPVQTLTKCEME